MIHCVSSGLLRNSTKIQDWISCERHLSREIPVKDRGEGAEKDGESLQTTFRLDTWKGDEKQKIGYEEYQATARFKERPGQARRGSAWPKAAHQRSSLYHSNGPTLHPHCPVTGSDPPETVMWWWIQRGSSWVGSLVNYSFCGIISEWCIFIITYPLYFCLRTASSLSSTSEDYKTFRKEKVAFSEKEVG